MHSVTNFGNETDNFALDTLSSSPLGITPVDTRTVDRMAQNTHAIDEAWNSSTETFRGDLEDVCLNEDANLPVALPPGARPEVLGNMIHECLFVGVIALAAASSVFLQRSILVIVADINTSLKMTPAETAWVNSASG
jgi:hypothetical protein